MANFNGTSGDDVIDSKDINLAYGYNIFAFAGNDIIAFGNYGGGADGGAGNDKLISTDGTSGVLYWTSPSGITANLETGIVADGWGTVDTLINVKSLSGSPYADNIIGSKYNDVFGASSGNDYYDGNSGYDVIRFYNVKTFAISSMNLSDSFLINWQDTFGAYSSATIKNIGKIEYSSSSNATSLILSKSIFDSVGKDLLIGTNSDEKFYLNPGAKTVFGNGGYDTVTFWNMNTYDFNITYDQPNDFFTVQTQSSKSVLYDVDVLVFSDKSLSKYDFNGGFKSEIAPIAWNAPLGSWLTEFRAGDFNGDGFSDLILITQVGSGSAPSPVFIFSSDGKGFFTNTTNSIFGRELSIISGGGRTLIGDFNNDFVSDVFQLNFGNDAPPFPKGENYLFLSSKSSGRLIDASASLNQLPQLNHGGSLSDVNNDNFIDLVINTLSDGNQLWMNDGTGKFIQKLGSIPIQNFLDQAGNANSSPNTYSALIDLNKDGFKDLVLGTYIPNIKSIIYFNDGSGNFSTDKSISLPNSILHSTNAQDIVTDISSIDIDNDGIPELILNITNGAYTIPYIQFLKKSQNSYIDVTDIVVPQSTLSGLGAYLHIYACDFNRDGFQDILASSSGGDQSSAIFMNKGDGTFYKAHEFSPGYSAVASDYDNDGMTDVITANNNNITVWTNLFNNGHIYRANFGGDTLLGSAGNDTFYGNDGNDVINGGGGFDTAIARGAIKDYSIIRLNSDVIVSDKIIGRDGNDKLTNIERIDFTDGDLIFDVTSANAPAAYRLYGGAFARTPDEGGFRFWASTLDKNVSLRDVATQFIGSGEFIGRYGASLSNAAFVDALYQNVLSRGGDAGGVAYWNRMLDNKLQDRSDVLVEFTQLPEFVGISAANINNGYWVV